MGAIYQEYTLTRADLADIAQAAGLNPQVLNTYLLPPTRRDSCLSLTGTPQSLVQFTIAAQRLYGPEDDINEVLENVHQGPANNGKSLYFWPLIKINN